MANAKKCDICGKFYEIPDVSPYRLDYEDAINIIRMHRGVDPDSKSNDELWLHFDACDECYQNVLDYILTKKADNGVAK